MKIRILAVGIAICALAGCDGSDNTSAPPPVAVTPPPPVSGNARVAITIPETSTTGLLQHLQTRQYQRSVKSYVSAKTLSLSVKVTTVNGAAPTTSIATIVNVNSDSSCTTGGGSISCSVEIAAPAGNDGLSVSTYAQADGVGFAISTGDTMTAIVAGETVDVSVDLLPVVASSSITVSPSTLDLGTAGTFTVTIVAKDITGAVIGGVDSYYTPITVTTKDTGGHVTSSPALPATLKSPADNTITFQYDGGGSATAYTFTVAGPINYPVDFQLLSNLQHLYVSLTTAVNVYDIQADGTITGPSRVISGAATLLTNGRGIAVDATGQIYVVNAAAGSAQGGFIAVYASGASGNVAPIKTLAQNQNPIYVAREGSAYITEPDNFDTERNSTITENATISEGPVDSPIVQSGIPPFIEAYGSAWDVYKPGGVGGYLCGVTNSYYYSTELFGEVQCIITPVEVITGTQDPGTAQIVNGVMRNQLVLFVGESSDIKFLPNGELMVASSEFGTSRTPALQTYQFVADVLANEYLQPTRLVQGDQTGLVEPSQLAFDSTGNVYVADGGDASGQGSVHVYASVATGNVAPIRNLAVQASGVAVGP